LKFISEQFDSVYFVFRPLAHHIKYEDNKLMINKIKDFLQKFRRQKESNDLPASADESDGSLSFKGQLLERLRNIKLPNFRKENGAPLISPNIAHAIDKFLSRESRENIHQIGLITIICCLTYTLGKVTALVVRGTPALNSARDYAISIPLDNDFNVSTLNQVKSINIFRTNTGIGGGKKKVADAKCDKSQQSSSLPIKLVNTVVLQDTIKSIASVQIRGDRSLQELREGDQIDNLAKIFHIDRLEILVKNLENGVCESIASEKAREAKSPISIMSASDAKTFKANKKMNGIDNVGNKFVISKALLDDKLKDIGAILTQARAIQIQNPDGSLSFKMTEMDPNGIFPYLGLQDQDTITAINGKPIYDLNEVMGLFGRIKNLENLSLGVKREGADSTQEYSIKK
jgi:type II secretory pathway component PulC